MNVLLIDRDLNDYFITEVIWTVISDGILVNQVWTVVLAEIGGYENGAWHSYVSMV